MVRDFPLFNPIRSNAERRLQTLTFSHFDRIKFHLPDSTFFPASFGIHVSLHASSVTDSFKFQFSTNFISHPSEMLIISYIPDRYVPLKISTPNQFHPSSRKSQFNSFDSLSPSPLQ